jgi:hypothetical protein
VYEDACVELFWNLFVDQDDGEVYEARFALLSCIIQRNLGVAENGARVPEDSGESADWRG